MQNEKIFMTIRETARTGLLPEHTLRMLAKAKQLPSIQVGNRVLINYSKLVEILNNPQENFV